MPGIFALMPRVVTAMSSTNSAISNNTWMLSNTTMMRKSGNRDLRRKGRTGVLDRTSCDHAVARLVNAIGSHWRGKVSTFDRTSRIAMG